MQMKAPKRVTISTAESQCEIAINEVQRICDAVFSGDRLGSFGELVPAAPVRASKTGTSPALQHPRQMVFIFASNFEN
jgi:hypothetical protein